MSTGLVALGIDAPPARLFEQWVAAGRLPHLAEIARHGSTARYAHTKRFRNERCWDTFLSGQEMASSGSVFVPASYQYFNESLQREDRYPPFYALGSDWRVCMFDLPAALSPAVNGLQVAGWGSELNAFLPASQPPGLMAELIATHGADPKLEQEIRVRDGRTGEAERSFVLPSLYDGPALLDLKAKLVRSVERRTDIALDLLARGDWHLFITLYPESHTANHMLWHLGEAHPLAAQAPGPGHGALEVLQAIDRGIARIRERIAGTRNLLVYTLDQVAQNAMDVPGMALLPELLYRWNFPGRRALAAGDAGAPVPALRTDYARHWKHEVWALRTAAGQQDLESPASQEARGDALSWNPANWYRPLWPAMKAFALPSVADGYVRLNVKGREAQGRLEPQEFEAALSELEALLQRCTNPRTGRPLVKELVRTRGAPHEAPGIPCDLVVCWDDASPADTLDSPALGRIGPLPYFRSGGHVSHGTVVENSCFACGPDIAAGAEGRDGKLEDLSATVLHLMGASGQGPTAGRPLIELRPGGQPA